MLRTIYPSLNESEHLSDSTKVDGFKTFSQKALFNIFSLKNNENMAVAIQIGPY